MFSKACEYAIRASILIATRSMDGERASLKDIANTLSDIIKPTNEELKNYYLRNDFYKELNQNLERKENALVGHITSKFGIEKEEAKKIISSLRH